MTDTPTEMKAQKIALATDATWGEEAVLPLENQINQDQGKSIGSSLKDALGDFKDSKGSFDIGGEIPKGIDAIKSGGSQAKDDREV